MEEQLGWNLLLVAVLFLSPIDLIDLQKWGSVRCSSGWFGETCKFMCQCDKGKNCSKSTGECADNSTCKSGMFGPGCQYVDLFMHYSSSDNPDYLNDRDPSTCNPDPQASSLSVSINSSIQITWFRVYTDIDMSTQPLLVELDSGPCPGQVLYWVYENILDISCDSYNLTRKLILSGPLAGHICGLEISGGRNVAVKQKVNQSSDLAGKFTHSVHAQNAVDGSTNVMRNFHSCSQTDPRPGDPFWTLNYSRPYSIYRVLIYNRFGYSHLLTGFMLELYDLERNVTPHFVFKDPLMASPSIYELQVPPSRHQVNFLKIWFPQRSNLSENVLVLCEVQTFGEIICPNNSTYGLECEQTCQCRANERCNQVTGQCSISCDGEGNSSHCAPSCPVHCRDYPCRPNRCELCILGFYGTLCEKPCPTGKFGDSCNFECPKNCHKSSCNSSSGHCFKCLHNNLALPLCEDATEKKEEEEEEFEWMYLLLLLLLIPLFGCIFVLYRWRTSPDATPITPQPSAPATPENRVESAVAVQESETGRIETGSSVDVHEKTSVSSIAELKTAGGQ